LTASAPACCGVDEVLGLLHPSVVVVADLGDHERR
jgi:hypothetical protein